MVLIIAILFTRAVNAQQAVQSDAPLKYENIDSIVVSGSRYIALICPASKTQQRSNTLNE